MEDFFLRIIEGIIIIVFLGEDFFFF